MNYFKLNGKVIEKYLVIFDKAKLLKLKEEIIKSDCLVVKGEFRGSNFWLTKVNKTSEIRKVRNQGLVKVRENMGGPDTAIYLFTYDEYFYTKEILFINRLLEEDATVIKEIERELVNGQKILEQQIAQKRKEIDEIANSEIRKKIELLEELESLLEIYTQMPNPYLLKLQSLIKLKLINSISLNKVEEVVSFWNQEFNKETINNPILKR